MLFLARKGSAAATTGPAAFTVALGVLLLVVAYGAWNMRRWVWLPLVVTLNTAKIADVGPL